MRTARQLQLAAVMVGTDDLVHRVLVWLAQSRVGLAAVHIDKVIAAVRKMAVMVQMVRSELHIMYLSNPRPPVSTVAQAHPA
jgi:hypothetical protein